MGFLSPLGLLALLAVPAIILLHLFRRRLRERRVAGLFLFAADRLAADAGRRRAPLRSTPSLWLESLAALLLALAIAGLTFGAESRLPHLVLVLDDSASMGAAHGGSSTVERAREAAMERLEALPSGATATVILTGPRPAVAAGPRAPLPFAREAVARWKPERPSHDFLPALHLGRELAADGGRLLFLTDRRFARCPPGTELRAFGRAAANAALLSARRSGGRVHVGLAAYGGLPFESRLRVRGSERPIVLEPGVTQSLSFDDPAPGEPLLLEIADDALAIDNSATLLPVPARIVGFCAQVDAETQALLRIPQIVRAMRDVVLVSEGSRAHLLLTATPGAIEPGRVELLLTPLPAGGERDDWIGPFLTERRHPLLDGVTLEGVVWGAGRVDLPGLPLLLAGEVALLSEEEGPRYRLNLDPSRTNLPASPDWPILFSNLCEEARRRMPGAEEINARLGEPLRYRLGAHDRADAIEWRLPDGGVERNRGEGIATLDPRGPGIHRLLQGDRELASFSVHFVDGRESDLTGAEEMGIPSETPVRSVDFDGGGGIETQILALLLLLVVVADWHLLGRGA